MKRLQDQRRTVWKAIHGTDLLLKWKNVSSEFLQGFAPGLALFTARVNDLDDGIWNILIKFTDSTCLRRIERSCKDRVCIQNDLENLIWKNRMLLKRNKCREMNDEKV